MSLLILTPTTTPLTPSSSRTPPSYLLSSSPPPSTPDCLLLRKQNEDFPRPADTSYKQWTPDSGATCGHHQVFLSRTGLCAILYTKTGVQLPRQTTLYNTYIQKSQIDQIKKKKTGTHQNQNQRSVERRRRRTDVEMPPIVPKISGSLRNSLRLT